MLARSNSDRDALLNELFMSFADFSEKAAQIFRDLSAGHSKKSSGGGSAGGSGGGRGGKAPHPKQKKLSGYQIFANWKRPELKAGRPNASFGAISQSIGAMWKEMSEADRNMYTERAADMDDAIVRNEAGSINVAATILAHERVHGPLDLVRCMLRSSVCPVTATGRFADAAESICLAWLLGCLAGLGVCWLAGYCIAACTL